eukprot:4043151-Karenia_brevis.AAC.1
MAAGKKLKIPCRAFWQTASHTETEMHETCKCWRLVKIPGPPAQTETQMDASLRKAMLPTLIPRV